MVVSDGALLVMALYKVVCDEIFKRLYHLLRVERPVLDVLSHLYRSQVEY